jgi:hypothetical protein
MRCMGFWNLVGSDLVVGDGPADVVAYGLDLLARAGEAPTVQELADDVTAALRAAPPSVVAPPAHGVVEVAAAQVLGRCDAASRTAPIVHGVLRSIAREYRDTTLARPPRAEEVLATFSFVVGRERQLPLLRDGGGRALALRLVAPAPSVATGDAELAGLVDAVLARAGSCHVLEGQREAITDGARATITRAIAERRGDPVATALLRARRPAEAAFIAPTDGVIAIGEDALYVHRSERYLPVDPGAEPAQWASITTIQDENFRTTYRLWPRTTQPLLVHDGAQVTAGQALTAGEVSIEDLLFVFGIREAMLALTERLAHAVELPSDLAAAVAEPMLSLSRLEDADESSPPACRALITEAQCDAMTAAAMRDGAPPPILAMAYSGYDQLWRTCV